MLYVGALTICLLSVYFVSAAGCHCFEYNIDLCMFGLLVTFSNKQSVGSPFTHIAQDTTLKTITYKFYVEILTYFPILALVFAKQDRHISPTITLSHLYP